MKNVLLVAAAILTAPVIFGSELSSNGQLNNLPSKKSTEYIRVESSSNRSILRETGSDDEGPYNDPQGEKKWYVRSCHAICPVLWLMIDAPITGAVGTVVFAEDNVVYLSPVVNNILGLGYVKGTINEDKIMTFQFPQYMGKLSDGTRLDLYCMNKLGNDENGWSLGAEMSENQTYKMQIAEDGTITPLPEYSETVIGWSPDGEEFGGYGDYGYEFVLQTDEPVTPPVTAVEKDCTWGDGSVGYFGKMVEDGEDLYIQNMFPTMPDSWVKCTKSANGYRFESGQLLGIYDSGRVEKRWSYGYSVNFEGTESDGRNRVTILEGMDLLPQGEGSYKSTTGMFNTVKYEIGESFFTFDKVSGECTLSPREEIEMLLTPKAPENLVYRIFTEVGDLCYISFHQPQYSVDGMVIYPDNLFYEVYTDGELFTFTHEDYPAIPEGGWTMIPYTFSDGTDTINSTYLNWSDYHEFFVYGQIKQIGIRSVCKVGDEVRYSEMAVASPEGVEGVEVDSEVISETLTNLAGVQVSNPGPGVYILTTRHADGTVRSTKVVY